MMLLDENSLKKIERFISKELHVNLVDASIFKYDENTYELFNKYTISKIAEYKYLVIAPYGQKIFTFLKNAVLWCTFNHRSKFYEMTKIEEIDIILSGIDMLIEQHQRLSLSAKNLNDRLIYLTKLDEDKSKKQKIMHELNQYILDSKFWQMKRFAPKMKSVDK